MVDNNPRSVASANFCTDWQAVRAGLDLLEGFLCDQVVGDNARARIAIIVEELVANIVEHSQSPSDQPIMLELERSGTEMHLMLSDAGIPFDPSAPVHVREFPPERGGGAGLALVQGWAHSMSYSRANGRNTLKLVMMIDG